MPSPERPFQLDEPMLVAAVDLIGRSGATEYEVGYMDDVPDARDARWWASAVYRGAKVFTDGHAGPDHASDALARKLLQMGPGAQCTHCGKRIMLQVSKRTAQRARRCVWARHGRRWVRGCRATIPEGQRAIQRPRL